MPLHVDMIGFVSENIQRSVEFYRLLGLPIADVPDGEDHHEYQQPNGLRLAWDTLSLMKQLDPEYDHSSGQRVGVAFLCDSPAHVDELHAKAIAAGAGSKMDPWDAFWGQRYAVIVDPDGYKIDLFAPLS